MPKVNWDKVHHFQNVRNLGEISEVILSKPRSVQKFSLQYLGRLVTSFWWQEVTYKENLFSFPVLVVSGMVLMTFRLDSLSPALPWPLSTALPFSITQEHCL